MAGFGSKTWFCPESDILRKPSCKFEETKNECRCLRASCKNCSEDLERIRKNRVWCKPCDQDIKFLKIRDHVSGHRHRHMKAIVSGVACPDCQGTEIFDFMKNNTFCEPCSQFIPKWCEHKNIHKHVHMEALWAKVPCPVCSGTEIDFNLCVNVNGKCKCRICSTREELQGGFEIMSRESGKWQKGKK